VQTFLPHPDFQASARALDRRRLGRQRVEALQLLNALTVPGHGWRHHPAARMWGGYEEALVRYCLEVCAVWCELGFQDTCAVKVTDALRERLGVGRVRTQDELAQDGDLPPWLGDEAFHRTHRSPPTGSGRPVRPRRPAARSRWSVRCGRTSPARAATPDGARATT
jgi:hypothetical protein